MNIGQLTSVSGSVAIRRFLQGYDTYARLKSNSISSDATYQYDYSYNSFGAIDTLTYPTSTSVTDSSCNTSTGVTVSAFE